MHGALCDFARASERASDRSREIGDFFTVITGLGPDRAIRFVSVNRPPVETLTRLHLWPFLPERERERDEAGCGGGEDKFDSFYERPRTHEPGSFFTTNERKSRGPFRKSHLSRDPRTARIRALARAVDLV